MTLEIREFELRAVDTDKREVSGIAVPWNTRTSIAGLYEEEFERGSVQDSDGALLYWRHSEPIGKITAHRDTEEGWEVTAHISETERGNEAYTLLRDGVISKFSIGFEPVEHRTNEDETLVTRTNVRVREVSLVPFPAYSGATVAEVRSSAITQKETMTDNVTSADLTEVRESIEDLDRRFAAVQVVEREPEPDTRTAGAVLQALAAGDDATIKRYNELQENAAKEQRAYTGGTTALAPVKDSWVGDLTRVFDASSGVLSQIFSTGVLPATGNNIEYAQLKSNSMKFEEQAAEGDDLAYGKVELETKTAPVKTYGGYTQLTRQTIERSTLPVLNTSLEALAQAAGARQKVIVRSAFTTLHTARLAAAGVPVILGATLAASTYVNWTNAVIDGAISFDGNALQIDDLVVSVSVFKKLASFTGSDGRPLFVLDGNGTNTVGTLSLPGLTGSLAGVRVVADPGLTGDIAAFVNSRAIRAYTSPLVSLQDENIVNLSKTFSVYRYGAVAAEIPAGVVPVKLAAA